MTKYFLKQKTGGKEGKNAAFKAMHDVETMLKALGYIPIPGIIKECGIIKKLLNFPRLFFFLLSLNKKDIILFVIPETAFKIKIINFVKALKHFSTICFVDDFNVLRIQSPTKQIRKAIKLIDASSCILVPNQNFATYIQQNGAHKSILIPVQVWDYLSEFTACGIKSNQNKLQIAYAGNLGAWKCPYIFKLNKINKSRLRFHLWGEHINDTIPLPSNCIYEGAVTPDKIPTVLQQYGWGLAWDGEALDGGVGISGIYTKYNNTHKCGLYLAAGLPIIAWENSGMAAYIRKQQVGICIQSLSDLPEVIEKMQDAEYLELCKNALAESPKIRSGYYFKTALLHAEAILQGQNRP